MSDNNHQTTDFVGKNKNANAGRPKQDEESEDNVFAGSGGTRTSSSNAKPQKMKWQSLADAGHTKPDDDENEEVARIPKQRPRSSALEKKFEFFDLVTKRARETNLAETEDEEAQRHSTKESMAAMPHLTADELNEMAENFVQLRDNEVEEEEEEQEVETSNCLDPLPVANRVSARDVTVLSGDPVVVVPGFLVVDRKVLREPIYGSVPWLTPLRLLIMGAFLLVVLVVSLIVALTRPPQPEVFPTTSPSPTLSLSPTISTTFQPSASALPSLRPSFSPSAHPTEHPSLSASPTALPTMANVMWSRVGTDVKGTAEEELLGISVALSANGNELRAAGKGVLRVYLLAGTDDWIPGPDLSDSITSLGRVAVSLDGFTIIASDYSIGKALVYRRVGAEFEQRGDPLVGKDSYDNFGYSVALSSNGTVVVVGALEGDYVMVYQNEEGASGDLTHVETIEGDADSFFGASLATSADAARLIVGAPYAHEDDGGAVFAYSLFPKFALLQRMDGGDYFGASVAISSNGDVLAAGAENDDYVEVYEADDSSRRRYSQLATRIDGFGSALSLSADGTRLAVGVPQFYQNGMISGRAFVYAVHPRRHQKIGEFEGDAPNDYFGSSVSLSGDGTRLAVGAPRGGEYSGLVRLFESA